MPLARCVECGKRDELRMCEMYRISKRTCRCGGALRIINFDRNQPGLSPAGKASTLRLAAVHSESGQDEQYFQVFKSAGQEFILDKSKNAFTSYKG